jgi:pyrroline-5-carboxylate reductase
MSTTFRLLFIGGGKMAEALLGGILSGLPATEHSSIAVVETLSSRRLELQSAFPGVVVADSATGLIAEAAVIAVKPGDVRSACEALRSAAPVDGRRLRSMPNTPALVGRGAAALAGGTHAGPADVQWALDLLGTVGIAVQVPESKLDAVTGLSGSGPAYVFLVAEALIEAGVFVGLSRDIAEALAKQTLLGAATLLSESSQDAPTLRANVTSPGGTTAAGLRALENHGVRAAFMDAVVAATNRSAELRG